MLEFTHHPMEHEVYEFLKSKGVNFPDYYFIPKGDYSLIGDIPEGKYVLKVMSPKIIHKSDYNAVWIGISKPDLIDKVKEMEVEFAKYNIAGVLVTPLVEDGVELILGSTQNPTFGTVVVFGIGGILVEILNDVVFGKAPLSEPDAEFLIRRIKHQDMLTGPRGLPAVDKEELKKLLVQISNIAQEHKDQIAEIDLNPVRVTSKGIVPLDARIILK